jgi:CheY-like chemotaxis protein
MDQAQIQQVVLNLLLNANDAIQDQGIITIRTGIEKDEGGNKADRIFCEMCDTGHGLSQEDLDHLFEPFFSSKPQGMGSGLGLSTSRGIIEGHGGTIHATNRNEGGARFIFHLPVEIVGEEVEELPRTGLIPRPYEQGILIADDEPLCLDVLKANLDEQGFKTWAAKDGKELLELAVAHQQSIHWVVTDWTMPGIHGKELIQELRQLLPQTRILVASGFILAAEELPEIDGILRKPFTLSELFSVMGITEKERRRHSLSEA